MTRKRVAAMAAIIVAAAVLGLAAGAQAGDGSNASPRPVTPIRHFIVLLQENHTFDNYFGTYPGADGIPGGVRMPLDPSKDGGPFVSPFWIGDKAGADLAHGGLAAATAYNGGRMDGFLQAQGRNGAAALAMGYYDRRDVPFYWNAADRYVLFDRFFSSARGGSFLNHVYWVAGGPGDASQTVSSEPLRAVTIFDRLQKAGVSWKFYIQNYDPSVNYRTLSRLDDPNRALQVARSPLLAIPRFLDDPALRARIVDLDEYYADLRNGTLPQVAYIAPSGASEHPPASLAPGQGLVHSLVTSLMSSGAWRSSAFMLAYDDWGGWYDHVRPPRRDANGNGFRVPALLISPYARAGHIESATLDFTSMLKFIEHNWKVRPLTRLDATAGSIEGAFDFSRPPRRAELIPLHQGEAPPRDESVRDATLYGLYGVGALLALALVLTTARGGREQRRPQGVLARRRS